MKPSLNPKIAKLAKEARIWAEKQKPIYENCCPGDVSGLCARTSAYLFKRLDRAKIKSEIHCTDCHVFLVIDGNVIDATASQFNWKERKFGSVLIEPLSKMEKVSVSDFFPWKTSAICKNIKELREFQSDWPEDQCA